MKSYISEIRYKGEMKRKKN